MKTTTNIFISDSTLTQFKIQADAGNLGLFEKVNDNLLTGSFIPANQFNDNIQTVEIPELSQKEVNTIFISQIADSTGTFPVNLSDTTYLVFLASQCPYEYGAAVYQARLLLSFISNAEYINACEIINYQNSNYKLNADEVAEESTENFIKLYPNPAKDNLTIEYSIEENEIISFYNYLGETVFSQMLNSDEKSLAIDISAFPSGLYMYSIKCSHKERISGKIIFSK